MRKFIPTSTAVLAVRCPYCHATPGVCCNGNRDSHQGKPRSRGPHPERVAAAEQEQTHG